MLTRPVGVTATEAGHCCCLQIVQLKNFDMRSDEAVRQAISRSNVVVNCLGADKETMNFSYEEVHVEFAERIARACAESDVLERLLHVSCLAASPDAPSRRLTTKVTHAVFRSNMPWLTRSAHQAKDLMVHSCLDLAWGRLHPSQVRHQLGAS